jgi:hypothetical protein
MANSNLALRMADVEAKLEQLTQKIENRDNEANVPWWHKISGTFANDPAHAEAMKLGRKYRESLRPKNAAKSTRKTVKKSNS